MSKGQLTIAVSSLGMLLLVPPGAQADSLRFGARVGFYSDAGAAFAGGEMLVGVAPKVYFNPNIEVVFKDDSYLTFNLDFHYDIPTQGRPFLWAGAGLGVISVNPRGEADGDTDVGLNLLFGLGLRRGPVIPYFQAKVIAKDDAEFSMAFGLRF